MARRIVLRIRKGGKVVADYDGFHGDECFAEAAKLKSALRARGVDYSEESVEAKPEAYNTEEEEERETAGW